MSDTQPLGRAVAGDPRQVLLACYTVLAVAAGARSAVQLASKAEQAPLAYTLSAVAAATYLIAVILLRGTTPGARRSAAALCTTELIGVLVVGSTTLISPGAFPDDTVWTHYGIGYGFLPAVLPIAALAWLATERTRRRSGPGA